MLEQRRAEFVGFVTRKVGDRALAEDLVQDAYLRLTVAELHGNEVAWFYRVLRNAVIDRARRSQTQARALEAFAHSLSLEEPKTRVCQCVHAAKAALKPSYREALDRVELAGLAVKAYADEAGISANSAGVRIHRARHALREQVARTCGACAERGCFDCSCQEDKRLQPAPCSAARRSTVGVSTWAEGMPSPGVS